MNNWNKGYIKTLKGDFGFIQTSDGKNEVFFHKSRIEKEQNLKAGDFVEYILNRNYETGKKPKAFKLRLLDDKQYKSKKAKIKKLRYFFKDSADMSSGLHHITENLRKLKSNIKKEFSDIDFMIEQVEKLYFDANILFMTKIKFSPDIDNINNSFENKLKTESEEINLWSKNFDLQEFGSTLEFITKTKPSRGRKSYEIVWGEWRNSKKQIFRNGYMEGAFNYSYSMPHEPNQTSVYEKAPPNSEWPLIPINQKGKTFYISSASVQEISQTSYVPSLPPKLSTVETAMRVIDRTRGDTEWQRIVDLKRATKIQQFIGGSDNIIANSVMIYIKNDGPINIQNNKLVINYNLFLRKQNGGEDDGKLVDRKLKEGKDDDGNDIYDEYKPLWIIDGQHRIIGINRNEDENLMRIPLVIFPKEFGANETAKLFAEINTLQEPLDSLHELFMQHRFAIDSNNIKRKFKDFRSESIEDAVEGDWQNDWIHSRANHLSYELLAKLAQDGPLKNSVVFLKQNQTSSKIMVSADQWVNYSRTWFLSCYKYKNGQITDYVALPDSKWIQKHPEDLFHYEVNNYFKAWVKTCNHKEWNDKKDRWLTKGNEKGMIQKKAFFIILLEIFPLTRTIAEQNKVRKSGKGALTIEDFMEVLSPFKWVDWTNREIDNAFGGSGETSRRSLEVWLCDAILHKKQYLPDEIINENNQSLPGRGITSALGKPKIEIESDNKWPSKNNPLIINSTRPFNARYSAEWRVEDQNEDRVKNSKERSERHQLPSKSRLKIYAHDIDFKIKELQIRVDWSNMDKKTGHTELIIKRPEQL